MRNRYQVKGWFFGTSLLFFVCCNANAYALSLRGDVCPDTKPAELTAIQKAAFLVNPPSCPDILRVCMEGFKYRLPKKVFAQEGIYHLHYKGERPWPYKCLIVNEGGTINYGCKDQTEDHVNIYVEEEWVTVSHTYPMVEEHDKIIYNEYPNNIDLQVLQVSKVVFEDTISISYKVTRDFEPGCWNSVCCYGESN